MQNEQRYNFSRVLRFALIALFLAVATPNALLMAQGTTVEARSYSAEAKKTVDGIDSSKIGGIKNAALRAQMRRAFDAVKALADNQSKSRERTLVAAVHREALKLKAKAGGTRGMDCEHRLQVCHDLEAPPEWCQFSYDNCMIFDEWITLMKEMTDPTQK